MEILQVGRLPECQIIVRTESPGKNNAALVHQEGLQQQQQHKDHAGIRMDMGPQELATQGFTPHQICGTFPLNQMTKEELSVSTKQTKDNKATKNRSIIVSPLKQKVGGNTKRELENAPLGDILWEISFSFLYAFRYWIGTHRGQQTCLGEELHQHMWLA